MQEQGKRLLLTVVLAMAVVIIWTKFIQKEEPPKPPTPAAAPGAAASPGSPLVALIGAPGTAAAVPAGEPALIKLTFPHVVATFSSACGGLTSWQLTDKRYEHDTTKGELLPARWQMVDVDASGKHVPASASELANVPACGAFDVNFVRGSTYYVPAGAVWKGDQLSPTEVRYTYASDVLEVVKSFTIVPDTYVVRMTVKVTARPPSGTEAHQQLAITSYSFQDPAELKNGSSRVAAHAWSSSTLIDDTVVATDVAGVISTPRFEPSKERAAAVMHWTGFDHPFLLVGFAPASGDPVVKQTVASDGGKGRPKGFMQTDMLYRPEAFKTGDAALTKTLAAYLGPKNYDDLQRADAAAGFATGFDKVIDLGWFAFIGKPLLWLLQKFQEVVGNWGIAIILLTIVVKLLTLYWTTKSMRSMKEMASLAPQMKALQTKYADDKQRQQAETMALYKEHGVNPIAGCLPMLLQMPIWLALYRMLGSAGELYQQPFILGWINDLTATDPYYILPIVLFVTMFVQTRLQPATADSAQQKFLQYGMPIMFGAMAFVIPAGLTLYMLTNNVLSALHSIYMNKFDKKSLEIAAKLKRNQEAATQAATGKKPSAPAGKRVIDAKAVEVPLEAQASAGDDSDDAPDEPAGTPGAAGARNRPRRKKRRR